jgi:hypothetical protein
MLEDTILEAISWKSTGIPSNVSYRCMQTGHCGKQERVTSNRRHSEFPVLGHGSLRRAKIWLVHLEFAGCQVGGLHSSGLGNS